MQPAAPADPGELEDPEVEADWLQPRGPHLPAVVRLLPATAWLFALLAFARLAWGLREVASVSPIDPGLIGQVLLFELPSVISILLAAALLARHRDAGSRMRALLGGMAALAVVEGLRVLASPLQPVFEWLTPGDPGVPFLVPSALVYQVASNVLNAAAIGAIALGLARARRFEDRSSSWPVAAVLAVLVVLVAVTGIISISRLPAEQLPLTATIVAYIVSTVVLNVLSAAAFGYLAATATAGARAGEAPELGWRLAAAGSWLVIGSLAALGVAGLVEVTPGTTGLMNYVVIGIEVIFSIGFVGLLLGFVLGLPAADPSEDAWDEEAAVPADAGPAVATELRDGAAAPLDG
ncbi:MAG: hypothetical protein HY262_12620 [Chloroflexi bacterium]|nr:hypothetical protein [Chloroflexota bacterium]